MDELTAASWETLERAVRDFPAPQAEREQFLRECQTGKEAWIRASVPQFDVTIHPLVLSDWLEENGRLEDARWMRRKWG